MVLETIRHFKEEAMRSPQNFTITNGAIHQQAVEALQGYLQLEDHGPKCTAAVILAVLLYAAARITSVDNACSRLRNAPTGRALNEALNGILPDSGELVRRINGSLAHDLPKSLRKGKQTLAIDETLIPYHGKPWKDKNEIRRSKPKSGTSHFHGYVTCYVVQHGERFTLAVLWLRQGDTLKDAVQQLMKIVRKLGIKVGLLLLDRGFYNVAVIRYLQRARYPFLMPVMHRGRSGGSRRFLGWKKSGYSTYTLCSNQGERATVQICVSCKNYSGQWKRHGRKPLVYAFWGFQPGSPRWVRETYRRRFGIETSYRQMNQARIFTCTRNPVKRLLYIGIALVLRNIWVWFHLTALCRRQGRHIILQLDLLRLRTMLQFICQVASASLGGEDEEIDLIRGRPKDCSVAQETDRNSNY